MEQKKLSFEELRANKGWIDAVIVFTEDSFDKVYSLESRSYVISFNSKYFDASMNGTSIFGDCLDGSDNGVRLDLYMHSPKNSWEVDYCYIVR